MAEPFYDRIGVTYTSTRRTEPRIAARIWAALGDARTVVNVGAGAGSYEPPGRELLAVEPSAVMRAQRPPGAAPCIEGEAGSLPFPDGAFDAAMAVLTDHHWADRAGGLRDLRRVARRAVVFTFDPVADQGWVVPEYMPEFMTLENGLPIEEIADALGGASIEPVPIPWDCADGFFHAWWRRPEAYLEERVRRGISVFARIGEEAEARFVAALRADLESGAWQRRHADLLELDELDLGYRLLVTG